MVCTCHKPGTRRKVAPMGGYHTVDPSRSSVKSVTKGLFSDWIAVRPTAARRRYRGCVAMQSRLAAALTTTAPVPPPSGSSWSLDGRDGLEHGTLCHVCRVSEVSMHGWNLRDKNLIIRRSGRCGNPSSTSFPLYI